MNLVSKLRLKIALLALPSDLEPTEILRYLGVNADIEALQTQIANFKNEVEAKNAEALKLQVNELAQGELVKMLANLPADALTNAIIANSKLDDLQKTQLCAILAGSPGKASYIT